MGHVDASKPLSGDCDTLISQATDIYLKIEALYKSIHKQLSATSVLKVMQTVGNINSLLEEARDADDRIAGYLNSKPKLPPSTTQLLQERQDIIARLSLINKNTVANANNIKSHLRHEIDTMSNGHKAIKGYKSAASKRSHIIRDSF